MRRERPADIAASRAIQTAAFDRGNGEPAETRLLDELRRSDDWLPHLSWVAEADDSIVGHNVCTRGHVEAIPCLGLGPIGIVPEHQRDGIGSALMQAMIGAADARDEPLIALLGDPAYYSRFGFVPSTELGVLAPDPDWGPYFQVRALTAWTDSITGRFRYAAPFDAVS